MPHSPGDAFVVLMSETTPKGVKVELVIPVHVLDMAEGAPQAQHFAWPQVRVTKEEQ